MANVAASSAVIPPISKGNVLSLGVNIGRDAAAQHHTRLLDKHVKKHFVSRVEDAVIGWRNAGG